MSVMVNFMYLLDRHECRSKVIPGFPVKSSFSFV